MENKLTKLQDLLNLTNKIFKSDISWEAKFDLIFSDNISRAVFDLISLDYYDPDTTYEEDVSAFVHAFRDYVKPLLTE